MSENDLYYQPLCQITSQPTASQRGLSVRLDVSLGKSNYRLRALVGKGWVKTNNFRRSDDKFAHDYLLTPSDASAKLQSVQDFLTRKEHEFDRLERKIVALRSELKDMRHNA